MFFNGRTSDAIKLILAGPFLIGIGISQAIYGWIGNGTLFRILYPAVCFIVGPFLSWWGYKVLRNNQQSAKREQVDLESANDPGRR